MLDISDTLIAKSDQLNADDLIEPITVIITKVNKNKTDQPLTINYEGDNGRPFKPAKTVRRILGKAWGKDGEKWVGKSMTLFNEPSVKWAGKPVGGIRVSHVSHIDSVLEITLSETRGLKKPHKVSPLQAGTPTQGAPPPAKVETPPHDEDGVVHELKIRLIKSNGQENIFESFEAWLAFMQENLPKIDALNRLTSFETTHKPIFDEYDAAGFEGWVGKAKEIVEENRVRLGGSTNGDL